MTIQFDISNNQVQYTGDQVAWNPNTGLDSDHLNQVAAGNYGNVQDISVSSDKIVIKTDLGSLTFNGPDLEPVKRELTHEGLIGLENQLPPTGQLFDLFAVFALLFEVAKEQRQAARETRAAEAQQAFDQQMNAASDLRSAAAMELAGTIISGVVNIAMGCASIAQGSKMMSMPESQVMAANVKWQGISSIGQSVAQMIKGGFDFGSQMFQAKSKEDEAYASKADHAREEASQIFNDLTQMLNDIRSTLKEINDSNARTLQHISQA